MYIFIPYYITLYIFVCVCVCVRVCVCVWMLDAVFFFNVISTSVGYLMPKQQLVLKIKKKLATSLKNKVTYNLFAHKLYTHTHTHIYIYIYTYLCVWCSWAAVFHLTMFNKIIDTFCLYNLIKILSSFLISVLVSGWYWWMNLSKLPRTLLELS